jgi:hypothetical protein
LEPLESEEITSQMNYPADDCKTKKRPFSSAAFLPNSSEASPEDEDKDLDGDRKPPTK